MSKETETYTPDIVNPKAREAYLKHLHTACSKLDVFGVIDWGAALYYGVENKNPDFIENGLRAEPPTYGGGCVTLG